MNNPDSTQNPAGEHPQADPANDLKVSPSSGGGQAPDPGGPRSRHRPGSELDAFHQLELAGQVAEGENFSPSLAKAGFYSNKLKNYRARTPPPGDPPGGPSQARTRPADGGRRITVPPDLALQQLPERLGGLPRLNIRQNTFHFGNKTITADEVGRLYLRLSNRGEKWEKQVTADALVELAAANAFDPVSDYLQTLPGTVAPLPMEQWQRLDLHLLGIEDPIAARFLPQFLIGAVARVFRPGCSVRRSPVLIGPQWRGKTRLGQILFGVDHWVENVNDLGKDDLLRLQAGWGVELSELNGITRRKDQEALKAFLTANEDVFRVPYGRGVARFPRRCVFWGTSNGPPLRDLSGSSRFVCIPIPDQMLPLDWAEEHRSAIWSRAVELFHQIPDGQEPWDMVPDAERLAIAERNANHQEQDPWSEPVEQYLGRRAAALDLPVKVPELLAHLEVPQERRGTAAASRVRAIAESLGWILQQRWIDRSAGLKARGLWPPVAHTGPQVAHTWPTPPDPSADAASAPVAHMAHSNSPTFLQEKPGGGVDGSQESICAFGVGHVGHSQDSSAGQGSEPPGGVGHGVGRCGPRCGPGGPEPIWPPELRLLIPSPDPFPSVPDPSVDHGDRIRSIPLGSPVEVRVAGLVPMNGHRLQSHGRSGDDTCFLLSPDGRVVPEIKGHVWPCSD